MKGFELILKGEVQGVCCRHYCSQIGRELAIHGSATNMSNGDVRVILNCDEASAIRYIQGLKDGAGKYRFFGSIETVERHPYEGEMRGDYVW